MNACTASNIIQYSYFIHCIRIFWTSFSNYRIDWLSLILNGSALEVRAELRVVSAESRLKRAIGSGCGRLRLRVRAARPANVRNAEHWRRGGGAQVAQERRAQLKAIGAREVPNVGDDVLPRARHRRCGATPSMQVSPCATERTTICSAICTRTNTLKCFRC